MSMNNARTSNISAEIFRAHTVLKLVTAVGPISNRLFFSFFFVVILRESFLFENLRERSVSEV